MARGSDCKVLFRIIVLFVLFSGVLSTINIKEIPVRALGAEVEDYDYVLRDAGVTFKWRPAKSMESPFVKMELSVEHSGWVAIGFREASKVRATGMQQADMAVVWVKKDGTPIVCDFFTDTTDVPKLDFNQDYQLVSGEEFNGKTRVAFQRKLVTEDTFNDVAFTRPIHLLWAHSPLDLDDNCTQNLGPHQLDNIGTFVERGVMMAMPLRESTSTAFFATDLFSVMGYFALFLFIVVN